MTKIVFVGRTYGAFGLKGEIKLSFESNLKQEVLKENNYLLIDNESYQIKSIRSNNKYDLISFKDFDDINKIDNLLNKEVYFDKDSISLDEKYFYDELLKLKIIDESQKTLGTVKELLYNKKSLYIKTDNLIIPVCDKYIAKIDINEGTIYVKNVGDLLL